MPFRVDITWRRSRAEPGRAERWDEMRRGFAVLAFAKRLPFDPAKLCQPSFLLLLRFQPTPSWLCRCLLSFITIALTFVSVLPLALLLSLFVFLPPKDLTIGFLLSFIQAFQWPSFRRLLVLWLFKHILYTVKKAKAVGIISIKLQVRFGLEEGTLNVL